VTGEAKVGQDEIAAIEHLPAALRGLRNGTNEGAPLLTDARRYKPYKLVNLPKNLFGKEQTDRADLRRLCSRKQTKFRTLYSTFNRKPAIFELMKSVLSEAALLSMNGPKKGARSEDKPGR
jgi:hypothetical protein